jgi:ABC-2 type transport system permease protein
VITLVAKREITEAFRARSTRILLALSAVAVVVLVIIARLASGSDGSSLVLVVSGGADAQEVAAYTAIGDAVGTDLEVTAAPDDAAATAMVADDEADIAVLGAEGGRSLLTEDPVDLESGSALATVVNILRSELALADGLAAAGLTPEQTAAVRSTPPPPVASVNPPSEDEVDSSRIGLAVVMNVLLFLLLQTYGGWVVQGVTREKASRVVEVLLSAITPRQLLFGKLLGIGVVALAHAAVLIATALVAAQIAGLDVLDGFRLGDIAVGAVWFLLGYILYCCAFAAAGALCSRAEDAQGAAMPIMMPMLAGYIVGFSAAGGASTVLWVFAFFPPTAVLCMPVLNALGVVPVWGVLLSMLLTLAMALLIALLAARIYERSILRTGKRVSWREALRVRADR